MYPRSVPIPIDEASISLLFHKLPVMVWCIIPGFNEGRVLLNYGIFHTSWVPPPLSMSTHVGLTCLKTTNAKNRENIPGSDRDPSRGCYTCKKLLHSIFQYKIPKLLMDHPDSAKRSRWLVEFYNF